MARFTASRHDKTVRSWFDISILLRIFCFVRVSLIHSDAFSLLLGSIVFCRSFQNYLFDWKKKAVQLFCRTKNDKQMLKTIIRAKMLDFAYCSWKLFLKMWSSNNKNILEKRVFKIIRFLRLSHRKHLNLIENERWTPFLR